MPTPALRVEPAPYPERSSATSTDDILTWGMECPDGLYTGAALRGESYRLFGNRGTARYVGLQTMDGIASTSDTLVDELDIDPKGNFEVILSADERAGNWLPLAGDHPDLTVRHFFYDWDIEIPSDLKIERITGAAQGRSLDPEVAVARQLVALGDFVHEPAVLSRLRRGAPA